jgi:small subunit ribosomal protein S2
VVAVVDSNSDPSGIRFPIPGNDDALRAIQLYCDMVAAAVLDGIQAEMKAAGVDVGEAAEAPPEDLGDVGEVGGAEPGAAPAAADSTGGEEEGGAAAPAPGRKPGGGQRRRRGQQPAA